MVLPMRRILGCILMIATAGCRGTIGSGGDSGSPTEQRVVEAAIAAVPFDSISGFGNLFRVVAMDRRVRRVPVAGPVDPHEHPVAFRLQLRTLEVPSPLAGLLVEDSFGLVSADTAGVVLAIVGTVSEAADSARVMVYINTPRSFGIVGAILLARRRGIWTPTIIAIQEG
jgi:hypothetical protein